MLIYLLNASETSSDFREPHIHTDYWPVNISTWKCIKYIFVVHNNWGNFWTHFVTFWMWLAWFYFKLYQLEDVRVFLAHATYHLHAYICYQWLTMLVSVCIHLDSVRPFTSMIIMNNKKVNGMRTLSTLDIKAIIPLTSSSIMDSSIRIQ